MVAGRANVVGTAFSRKMLIIFACATCAAIYLFRSPTTETGLQSFIGLNQNSPAQLFGANTDETSRGCRAPYAPIGFVPNKQEFLYKQLRREFRLALIDVDGKSGQAALKCWSEAGLSDDGKKCAYNDGWSHFSVEHLLGEALRTHPVTKMIPSKQELKEASFTDPYWVSSVSKKPRLCILTHTLTTKRKANDRYLFHTLVSTETETHKLSRLCDSCPPIVEGHPWSQFRECQFMEESPLWYNAHRARPSNAHRIQECIQGR